MRRPLLLLTILAVGIVIATLMRSAAPDAASAFSERHDEARPVVTEFVLESCTISVEPEQWLASSDAAQPFPAPHLAASEIALALVADERHLALAPGLSFKPPGSAIESFRITIRPPPATHLA